MPQSLETWFSIIVALAVGGTLIWSLTGWLSLLCRRGSAALRHRLWGLSCAAVLIAPLAALTVPLPRSLMWSVPLLKVAVTAPAVELSTVEMPEPHFTEMGLEAGQEHGLPMFVDIGEMSAPVPQPEYVPVALEDMKSPASSAPPRDLVPSLSAVLIGLWCAGLLVALAHGVLARRRIAGILRRSLAVTHEPVLQLARELTQRLGLRRPVRVLTSAETAVPFVTGIACPALVLPTGFGAWPAERLPVVLVHELMHVKRGDVAWQSLAQMCLAATWFHPLAWLALWRLRVEREHACDDAVLLAGYRPSDYASQLVEVASDLRRGTLRFAPAVAMASRSPIERRVRAILDATLQRGPAGRWRTAATLAGLSAMLLVVAAVTPGRSAVAVEEPQAEAKQERIAAEEKGKGELPAEAAAEEEEESRRVERALDEHVDIGFVDARLSAVLAELARQCRTPIRLETVAFAKRGVSRHSPVTVQITGVSLRSALKLLLQSLSNASDPNQPTFTGRSGVLVISLGPDAVERAKSNPRSATPQPAMMISGIVRDAEGAPAPGIAVSIHEWQSTTLMTTDADGRFIVTVNGIPQSVVARNANGDLQAYWLPTYPLKDGAKELSAELKLEPARRLEIQVVSRGKPVQAANAAVVFRDGQTEVRRTDETGTARFSTPADETIEAICAWSSGLGLDYVNYSDPRSYNSPNRPLPPQPEGQILLQLNGAKTATIHLQDEAGLPAAGVGVYPWTFQKAGQLDSLNLSFLADEVSQTSDAEGNATFDWLPDWQEGPITFWPRSTEFVHSRINFDPEKAVDRTLTHILLRYVDVSGVVLDSEGNPASHAQVSAVGAGHSFDEGRGSSQTNEHGRYSMRLAPDRIYLVTAASSDGKQKGTVSSFVLRSGEPVKPVGIGMQPATRVFGRVTLGPNQTPQPNSQIQVYHYGTGLHELEGVSLSNPDNSNYAVQPINVYSTQTDASGRFELLLGPGKYDIRGPAQVAIRKFTISNERELEFNFHSDRPDRGLLKGRVVAGDPPVGVAHARISGIARYQLAGLDLDATADADGNFQVDRERFATVIYACSPDMGRHLGGIREIGPGDETVTLQVAPVAAHRMRILNSDRKPLPVGSKIIYGVSVELGQKAGIFRWAFGGTVATDPDGRVTLNSLVVGQKYEVRLVNPDGRSYGTVIDLTPEQPGLQDIGDVVMPRSPAPYKPLTLAERIQGAFENRQAPIEQHANALRDAPLGTLRILTVFAAPEAPWVESLFEVHFDREKTGTLWDNYRTLAVSLSPEKWSDAEALARKLGVTLPADRTPLLVVQDATGKVLVSWTGEDVLTTDGKTVDREKLLALLQMQIPEATNARTLLDDAIKQAKAENKRVFVQETATWCGPCWMLSRFLDRHRANWSQDYIWVKLDSRWEHAQEIAKELRQEAEGGIPWVAILDADGQTLATSNDSEGENIGFPSKSERDGIRHFLKMLRSTSQRMTEDDFQTLQRALEGTE